MDKYFNPTEHCMASLTSNVKTPDHGIHSHIIVCQN